MNMEHIDIVNFNRWAKSHITNESRFDNNGNIIMENNINYKSTGIISRIFSEHWNSYYSKMKDIIDTYRPNAPKEVQKVIDCSNHNLGSSVYVCPNCDEVFFCHHSCKGKLCSSCGIKAQKIKVEHILEKCITCNHRHITFTIPNDLNHFFFKCLNTNDLLFDSVCETIYSVVNGKVKKHKISYWLLKYKDKGIMFYGYTKQFQLINTIPYNINTTFDNFRILASDSTVDDPNPITQLRENYGSFGINFKNPDLTPDRVKNLVNSAESKKSLCPGAKAGCFGCTKCSENYNFHIWCHEH